MKHPDRKRVPTRAARQGRLLALARLPLTARGVQIALGALWLLDGLLQFKSFMYTHAIITEVFAPTLHGQPSFIAAPMRAFQRFYGSDLTLWNTLAGEIQVAIGLGLIISRRTVRPALAVSFAWAFVVWWFGEGFGGVTSNTLPAPLMGAPGAVILYALLGLLVWPKGESAAPSPAGTGPLGDRGGLLAWSGLWVLSAALWLVNVNRAQGATSAMLRSMAAASPHWLSHLQESAARAAQGHGTGIAVALALASIALAAAVWTPLRVPALLLGIVLSLAYWVLGQSLGGPFWTESATDVNAAPLFVLLALALLPVAQAARMSEADVPAAVPARGVHVG